MKVSKMIREKYNFLKKLLARNFIIILALTPIIYLLAVDFNSLSLAWNQGRGGFIFAAVFLAIEWMDAEKQSTLSRAKLLLLLASTILMLTYFTSVTFLNLQKLLWNLGASLGVLLLYSWIWIWDYVVFAGYLVIIFSITLGLKGLRSMVAGIIYLLGMAILLMLDSLFPYSTLGPLQYIVPILLAMDAFLILLTQVGQATISGNIITLHGKHGVSSLAVFWPSAGVHSMIIYFLVMTIFLLKIDSSKIRKAIYLSVGALGTFLVNGLRIFLLSTYILLVTADPIKFEEFHAVAGEILFIPWLLLYIILISRVEMKRLSRSQPNGLTGRSITT